MVNSGNTRLIFSLLLIVYLAIILGRKMGFFLPNWINGYYGDLLCIPTVLYFAQLFIEYIQGKNVLITKGMITVVVLYFGLVFEIILPKITPSVYTKDYLDIFMYSLGGIIFYYVQKLKSSQVFSE